MCVKLQPQPIHFPPLDIWSTHFQWSWKLEERWCPGRIHPFKNECAPRYTCFSWWSSSNFSSSLSLPVAGIKQIQELAVQWHRAEDVYHLVQNQWERGNDTPSPPWNTPGILVGASWYTGMKGETRFYQARAERWWKLWQSKVIELRV